MGVRLYAFMWVAIRWGSSEFPRFFLVSLLVLCLIHETAGQLRVTSSAKRNDIIFPRRTASVTFGSEWLLLVGVRKA